ncbi:DsbA family protein [Chondromyces crocatus]|uniref:DSBA oxidoreductase n=1 Tax=Chondromyces crocatus TaxID=52 RepID=A0A0K1E9Q6_CHOCO|nr:thioredoxin domain-containing protein [Chondromyces crocatus]AKT37569.1 uncharacterized protein CMC5_017100 [Chondromyces crocatus]
MPFRPSRSLRLPLLLATLAPLAACAPQTPPPTSRRPPTALTATVAVPPAVAQQEIAQAEPEPGDKVPVPVDDPAWGNPLAPVTLVTWGDYECPFTSKLVATLLQLQAIYGPDTLRIVWRHNPLPFHKNAVPAHVAAETVFRVAGPDAFWRFHHLTMANQRTLAPENFDTWAAQAGAPLPAYRAALELRANANKVDRDMAEAKRLGITGTPASLINGVFLSGALPLDRFRTVIDEQLEKATALRSQGVPPTRIYAQLSDAQYVYPERAAARPTKEAPDTTVWSVPIDGSPIRGNRNAPITLVMFAEFQCPFSARVLPTLEALEQRYGDKLRIVFKHTPLPFHHRAIPASQLAIEAQAQKGEAAFWKAFKLLFENQKQLEDNDLDAHARTLGLNVAAARRAITTSKHKARIDADMNLGEELAASGTPHFFVNGRRLLGAQPAEAFTALIDELLPQAQALLDAGTPPAKLYDTLQKDAKKVTLTRIHAPAATRAQPGKGAPLGAPVTIQFFGDLQCPFTKRVLPTIQDVLTAYPGKVRVVWRHLPLPFHKEAPLAAAASMEAFKQKGDAGFWAFLDRLWQDQSAQGLGRPQLERHAAAAGLDLPRFRAALDAGTHDAAIALDQQLAEQLHLSGTPAFAINDYYLSGAQPLAAFKKRIDKALGPKEPIAPGSIHGEAAPAPAPVPSPGPSPLAQLAAAKDALGAKHILIMHVGSMRGRNDITRTKAEARARAETALKAARAGTPFADLVTLYSDEPGADKRGGDLGRFGKGMMVREFEQGVESLGVGQLGITETPFGFHVILRTH